ncbi:MAG: response regulator [Verrucomicrobiota bacterium]|nr:response regulator [Verrucomicrobiota bacterium]
MPAPSIAECLQTAIAPKGRQVLVAEDDPVSAKILATLLTRGGYEPVIARSGDEAWELFDRTPVRLVVSDWMMPGMDGLQLCAKIRNRAKTLYTYFILLTANHASAENYTLAATAGVDDFLTKPLDKAELIALLPPVGGSRHGSSADYASKLVEVL